MMSEERFFQEVRTQFGQYAPDVPARVYSGMRRKLWMGNFFAFQLARMNVWYALVLCGAVATGIWASGNEAVEASKVSAASRALPALAVREEAQLITAEVAVPVKHQSPVIHHKSHDDRSDQAPSMSEATGPATEAHTGSTASPANSAPEEVAPSDVQHVSTVNTPSVVQPVNTVPVRRNAPAPLKDQLKSNKKEVRLLIDVVKYNDTTKND